MALSFLAFVLVALVYAANRSPVYQNNQVKTHHVNLINFLRFI